MEDRKTAKRPGTDPARAAEPGGKPARRQTPAKAVSRAKTRATDTAGSTSKAKARGKTRARATAASPTTLTALDRRQMVEMAAYFRAERRGFEAGHEAEDWLAAEAEVDAQLAAIPVRKKPASRPRKRPVS